jgi:hypothetical protein
MSLFKQTHTATTLTSLTSFGKLTDFFFLLLLLDGKLILMMLFDGGLASFIFTGRDLVTVVDVAEMCSSFDLKQFEHKSFFQAFCTKRGHGC